MSERGDGHASFSSADMSGAEPAETAVVSRRAPPAFPTLVDEKTLRDISRARRQPSDSNWEDVSSDEEGHRPHPGNGDINGRNFRDAADPDGWEDEISSEDEDEDAESSVDSSATATRPASSSKRALQEYRQSRRALMLSESDNVGNFNRMLKGGQKIENATLSAEEGDRQHSREMRRVDTAEQLSQMEPFSAGRSTETFDQAEPAGRAHEFTLEDGNSKQTTRTPSRQRSVQQLGPQSHSRKGSSNNSRSPLSDTRAALRENGISSKVVKSNLFPAAPEHRLVEHSPDARANGVAAKEVYASEPVSPSNEVDEEEWFRASADGLIDDAQINKASHDAAKGASNAHAGSGPADAAQERQRKSPTPEMLSLQLDQLADAAPPFSLWDYLKEEVMATDFDSTQELKWERVTNFISIPFWMEKIMVFGFAVCLDSFLYTFTILPLRSLVALSMWIRNNVIWLMGGQKRYLHSSHKCDILKALLIVLSCYILSRISDASKMYHSVRGQDVVKLYVIFNVLEIADRLCCSFGQDLLDSLFSRLTLARRKDGRQPYLRPIGFFLLSLCYVLAHTLVLFYQLVTLNVAINSYDNALLTLLLSNQFVEIKGSVFKKFEKENLFQLTCADIVERFQLTLMLSAIGLRNLIEVSGATSPSSAGAASSLVGSNSSASMGKGPLVASTLLGPLPTSFTVFPSFSLLETTFTPVCIVLASECLVDWLKHAFITKFNHIRPSVYGRFMDVLCRDLTVAGRTSRRKHNFVDQSPVVSRRLGFAAIPLACLLVRMTSQIMSMLRDDSHFDECAMPDAHHRQVGSHSQSLLASMGDFIRSCTIFVVKAFIRGAESKVDLAFNYLISASAWILTIFIAWIFLVAVKLLLGTNLVSYASYRYSTMEQREREEELNARDRQPIGVDKEEKAYETKLAQLLDKRDDDATRIGLNGQQIHVVPYKKEKKPGGAVGSLMDVDRYSMIRSRIW